MAADHTPQSSKRSSSALDSDFDYSFKGRCKRQKIEQPVLSYEERLTEWWDTLSRLWLTRRALREFERRAAILKSEESREIVKSPRQPQLRRSTRIRKRQLANNFSLPRKRVETEGHKRFARRGGPDLSHLRSIAMPKQFNAAKEAGTVASKGKKRSGGPMDVADGTDNSTKPVSPSSAYDRDFEQKLWDNGIFMRVRGERPGNFEEIEDRLKRRRRSLSPTSFTNEKFKEVLNIIDDTVDEHGVDARILPILAGDADYRTPSGNSVFWTNLTEFAPKAFKTPRPDRYYGVPLQDVHKHVRDTLDTDISPSTDSRRPIIPNMCVELKGPDGTGAVMRRQACFDGALCTRVMQILQSYGSPELVFDGNAYALSATYHEGTLRIHAHHLRGGAGKVPEYHMAQVGTGALDLSANDLCQSVTIYRNARDWATEQRQKFVQAANRSAVAIAAEEAKKAASNKPMASLPTPESDSHTNGNAAGPSVGKTIKRPKTDGSVQ